MTIGEINAVMEYKIKQGKGSTLSEEDYDELLEDLRAHKRGEK